MFRWSSEWVFVHYLRIQAVCNTLPRFFSLFYYSGRVTLFFNYVFHFLVCLHEDFCLWRGEICRSCCHGGSVNLWSVAGSIWGSRVRALIPDRFQLAWWIRVCSSWLGLCATNWAWTLLFWIRWTRLSHLSRMSKSYFRATGPRWWWLLRPGKGIFLFTLMSETAG